jgi:DsbC/DsbD-like thiol-disulfide interchange protein
MALTRLRTSLAFVLAALTLAALTSPALARLKKSGDVVKATYEATKADADGNLTITLTLKIDKTYHLYANPVGNDDLADAATVVTVEGKEKPESVKIEYPAGEVVKDKTLGDYKVYEDKVTIKAQVRRAKGDTEPLTVSIKLQACTSSMCLVPDTIKLTVK